jgi:carbamoyl-phosphate synthase large subunit
MSRSEISILAAGAALGAAVVILWKRSTARRLSTSALPAPPPPAPPHPEEPPLHAAAPPPVAASASTLPVVLVTGAGGAAGVGVVRALKAAGARVIAVDSDDSAVGLQLADVGRTVPLADEPDFLPVLCGLAAANGARAIVSTVDEELPLLATQPPAIAAAGVATWLPGLAAVRMCLDKWAFAQAVAAAGVPHPPTNLGRADGVPGPWIVKPRFGRDSSDLYTVDDAAELSSAIAHTPNAIVQTRLEGLEFTIDALVDHGGVLAAAVPRWRLGAEDRTFEDPKLVWQAQRIVTALQLEGAVSISGFMLASSGLYCFTQVKPRFSDGLSLSLAAGADLVGEYVRGMVGLPLRRERLVHRPGVTLERVADEVILST